MAVGAKKRDVDGENKVERRSLRDDESEAAERRRRSTRQESTGAANARWRYRAWTNSERFRAQIAKESEKTWVESGVVGEGGGRRLVVVEDLKWMSPTGKTKKLSLDWRSC